MVFNFFDKRGGRPRIGSSKPFEIFQRCCLCIVSTILILPIRKLIVTSDIDLKGELEDGWIRLVAYFFAFLVICAVWESQVHRFYDSFPYRRCLDLVKSRVFDVHIVFALRLRIGGKIPGEILPSFVDL